MFLFLAFLCLLSALGFACVCCLFVVYVFCVWRFGVCFPFGVFVHFFDSVLILFKADHMPVLCLVVSWFIFCWFVCVRSIGVCLMV